MCGKATFSSSLEGAWSLNKVQPVCLPFASSFSSSPIPQGTLIPLIKVVCGT